MSKRGSYVELREVARTALAGLQDDDVALAICGKYATVRRGLYCFVFRNTGKNIWDANRGKEKVVIPEGHVSVRPGKFEHRLIVRLDSYHHHLHRLPHGSGPKVLGECFQSVFWLEWPHSVESLQPAETLWNRAVRQFLRTGGLYAGKAGDSLWVGASKWTAQSHDGLRVCLKHAADKILSAPALLAGPRGSGR